MCLLYCFTCFTATKVQKLTLQMPPHTVSHASLNSGDVFILDAGLKLYQWNGKDSNKYEKAKALDVVQARMLTYADVCYICYVC